MMYYISPLEGRVKTPLKEIPIFKPQIPNKLKNRNIESRKTSGQTAHPPRFATLWWL
jgi:hypothetical protein